MIRRVQLLSLATLVAAFAISAPVSAAVPVDSSTLVEAVDADAIRNHLVEFQAIAEANGGTRASGTPGYEASVAYVVSQLEAAGYDPDVQAFTFPYVEVREAAMEQVSPEGGETYVYNEDFFEGFGSPNGAVTGTVQAIDILIHENPESTSTSGCESSDFDEFDFTADNDIALIQRGSCDFIVKVQNAVTAGVEGVIIFNEGNAPDRTDIIFPDVTGSPIPVLGTSFEIGAHLAELAEAEAGLVMRIALDIFTETRTTWNVLAELTGERDDRDVLVGAHLDSVLEGPGINDNGSGSAMILELALEMAGTTPVNTVHFAWWGAEESGLLGAEHYASQLSKAQLKDLAVNLNFDMVASPNFVRFVYDGDAGPVGSSVVEDVFLDWFASQDLATEPTEFDGRSDYGPFILRGVPAGGLFTGAEGIKTQAQEEIYGGEADKPYDPCYHAVCDTIENINLEVLEQMADAAAHATLTFAMTSAAVSGTAKGNANGHMGELDFLGSRAIR